ncbi:MAG: phosphate acyltransferase PlsX [Rhodospirillales bacterium]|jgi:glycerol-3-phosphate acyltransferase PlsX|nr:phosphate acyltransferase PlsX [Rhodospirillales bacterium]MBT4007131.1 phosphate acyltransferase PlsX [Rhodospirillales bacterium]MBT5113464.1 phosphate acyltransferase PlsX [Rhodospirillales bacterium]MBT5673762.1 phosphate acyltransferase PlsX [Rhodospirillales bacterium]MBT6186420.1 phosphate acyltransferase PlsX [Rhodospirillales bacterium]
MSLTIALDAMGGDGAPEIVVDGADLARVRHPNVSFIFYGDEARLAPLVAAHSKLAAISTIQHTDIVVSGEEKPSRALRKGRGSSMGLAIDAVKKGDAQGVVSAGNTGALMAMAKLALRTLPGISRPAIATMVPTDKSECVMLDLGANIQCDERNLVEFAIMGEVFSRTVLGLAKPTIALLNVGEEDMKGHESVRQAAATLRDIDLPIEFIGFVEGDAVWSGAADVVVTDGFTGNVALKTAEGIVKMYSTFLRNAYKSSPLAMLGYFFSRRALNKMRAKLDPRRYNGAMLVGLNGIVIKSHGGTDAFGFSHAVGVAVDMIEGEFNERISEEFDHIGSFGVPTQNVASS